MIPDELKRYDFRENLICDNVSGQTSPWSAKGDGAVKRMAVYQARLPEIAQIQPWREVYQLIRQYVYAKMLAATLDKQPRAIPLINQAHCGRLEPYYNPLLQMGDNISRVFQRMRTWQEVKRLIEQSPLADADRIIAKIDETFAAVR